MGGEGAESVCVDYALAAGGTSEQLFALATTLLRPLRGRVAVIVSAAEVVAESIDWLWSGRLARGMLTNLGA